jgi:hypothetical protein
VRLASPEDGPLGSKHVVLYMLINNCCVDGGICVCSQNCRYEVLQPTDIADCRDTNIALIVFR